MISTLQAYSVLIPGVTGGDVVKVGTALNVNNCTPKFPTIDVRQLTDPLIVKYDPVAETLAVWTVTAPTPVVGVTYGVIVNQVIPFIQASPSPGIPVNPGTNYVKGIVTSGAVTGSTATTVATAIDRGLDNLVNPSSGFQYASVDGGAGTLTVTALAGYPLLKFIDDSSAGPGMTLTNGTPGVASIGTYNDLIRLGVDPQYIVSGHTYGFVKLNYQMLLVSGDRTVNLTFTQTLYVDKANTTNYNNFWTALKTAIGTIFP